MMRKKHILCIVSLGLLYLSIQMVFQFAQAATGTSVQNAAPIITSHSGQSSVSLSIAQNQTAITTVTATDSTTNVIGEYGTTTLTGNTWKTIGHHEMCSPITVVSHRQKVNAEKQRAPRIKNKSSTSFQVNVDNYNSTIGTIGTQVDYIVMNAGNHTLAGGARIEAGTNFTTGVTCRANSSNGARQAKTFSPAFTNNPAVLHTVSSYNDTSWVVSAVNNGTTSRGAEPTKTTLGFILQRSFNSCSHSAEYIDYMAFEPGHYTLPNGDILDAQVTPDTVNAVTSTGRPVNFLTAFTSVPQTVMTSQLGEDGGHGGYSMVHTGGGVLANRAYLTIDEDGPSADRGHTYERTALIAFEDNYGTITEQNSLSYLISGGADAAKFSLNSTNGSLSFLSAQSSQNPTDTNSDGIYEVEVSVCDSHCNQKCSTQSFSVSVNDTVNPTITGVNHAGQALLPGGNHSFVFDYYDNESGIDTGSHVVTLKKMSGGVWGSDISSQYIDTAGASVSTTQASYSTLDLPFGKYQIGLSVKDMAGNSSSTFLRTFYIDRPEFSISHDTFQIGDIEIGNLSTSQNVTLTVKTIGAGFHIFLNDMTLPHQTAPETIENWDGTQGVGYVDNTSPTAISDTQSIISEAGSLNTSGNQNIYTYPVSLGSIVDILAPAGNYDGTIDVSIDFLY